METERPLWTTGKVIWEKVNSLAAHRKFGDSGRPVFSEDF